MLKKLAMCIGVLFAVAANANLSAHAKLVGQRLNRAANGASSLTCRYAGPHANYEIIALHGSCAPFIEVE